MSIRQLYKPNPDEKLVFVLRPHPLTFVKPALLFLLMLVLPPVAYFLLIGDKIASIQNPLLQIGAVLLAGVYYLCTWLFFFSQFTDYYLDIDIVTDDRILDIEQRGLFNRVISELNLARIQDVHSEVKGIISTMFNYGTVHIQTAGEEENFVFEKVADPNGVRQKILELANKDRQKEGREMLASTAADGT